MSDTTGMGGSMSGSDTSGMSGMSLRLHDRMIHVPHHVRCAIPSPATPA